MRNKCDICKKTGYHHYKNVTYCPQHWKEIGLPKWQEVQKEYKEKLKQFGLNNTKQGQEYWQSRGIQVGEKVRAFAGDLLTGGLAGGTEVTGIAKVSKRVGAYVYAPQFQKGYLSPDRFFKLKKK